MKKIKIDPDVIKKCKKERELLRQYLAQYSFLWNPNLEIPKKFKDIIEDMFPAHFHGEDILNYEAWSFRSYLETILFMGYSMGKNPKKFNENKKKINNQSKRLEKFKIKIANYSYYIDQLGEVEETDDKVFFHVEFAMNKIEMDKSLFYKELNKTLKRINKLTNK
jgi:hypothetical protein